MPADDPDTSQPADGTASPTPKNNLIGYAALIDMFETLERDAQMERNVYNSKRLSPIRAKQKALKDQLLNRSHEIARLLSEVQIHGFDESEPQRGRALIQRAIGKYTDIENGTYSPPKPPGRIVLVDDGHPVRLRRPAPTVVPPRKTLPVWASLLLTAGVGLASAFLGAFFGVKQTCLVGDEELCAPRNGVTHVRLCAPDGRSYGPCYAVDNASPDPQPAIVSPPPDGVKTPE